MQIPQSSASSGTAVPRSSAPGRFLTVQAPATALPVNRVHDGGDRTEILSVVIAAAWDITARGDLAQDPLPPAQIRHRAAITPALIRGERRIDLRQAHHPDDLAAVHLTSLLVGKPDNATILMPYTRKPAATHRASPRAHGHADPADADHAARHRRLAVARPRPRAVRSRRGGYGPDRTVLPLSRSPAR